METDPDMTTSLIDLLVALAGQRFEFDWAEASQQLHLLLTNGCELEGT